MRDAILAQAMLSLFIPSDRAEAIAGDLSEERAFHGSGWFWLHVFATIFAVFRAAFVGAPLRVGCLAVSGCALLAGPAFAGITAIRFFPQHFDSPISWLVLSLIWWSGALWTGVTLVSLAPTRGMAACLTIIFVGEVLLIAFGFVEQRRHGLSAWSTFVFASAFVAAAPLLAGGAIARRRVTTSMGLLRTVVR